MAILGTWWKKYKRWLIVLAVVYLVLVAALILTTRRDHSRPFQYQIF